MPDAGQQRPKQRFQRGCIAQAIAQDLLPLACREREAALDDAISDAVLLGRSRTEISFTILAPSSGKASLSAAERRLARKIAARVRA